MEKDRMPRPGDIYHHFKGNPYQIITVATHTETGESLVVYQALYGDFKTYARPLSMFLSKTDKVKYPEATQEYRFALREDVNNRSINKSEVIGENNEIKLKENNEIKLKENNDDNASHIIQDLNTRFTDQEIKIEPIIIQKQEDSPDTISNNDENSYENINALLLKFLDATSYTKKLDIITTNTKHLTDRLINDMAVSLDCTVEEGPIEQRIQGLVNCLQAMRRFEDRRLR